LEGVSLSYPLFKYIAIPLSFQYFLINSLVSYMVNKVSLLNPYKKYMIKSFFLKFSVCYSLLTFEKPYIDKTSYGEDLIYGVKSN